MPRRSFRLARFAIPSGGIRLRNLVYDFVLPVGAYDGYMRYLHTYSQDGSSERLRVDGGLLRVTRSDVISFGGNVSATFRSSAIDVLAFVSRREIDVSVLGPLVNEEDYTATHQNDQRNGVLGRIHK